MKPRVGVTDSKCMSHTSRVTSRCVEQFALYTCVDTSYQQVIQISCRKSLYVVGMIYLLNQIAFLYSLCSFNS